MQHGFGEYREKHSFDTAVSIGIPDSQLPILLRSVQAVKKYQARWYEDNIPNSCMVTSAGGIVPSEPRVQAICGTVTVLQTVYEEYKVKETETSMINVQSYNCLNKCLIL
jgi:hypothetical protein